MTHARIPFAAYKKRRLFAVKTNTSRVSSSSRFGMRVWVPQKQIKTAVSTPAGVTSSHTESYCAAGRGLFHLSPIHFHTYVASNAHRLQVNHIHVEVRLYESPPSQAMCEIEYSEVGTWLSKLPLPLKI